MPNSSSGEGASRPQSPVRNAVWLGAIIIGVLTGLGSLGGGALYLTSLDEKIGSLVDSWARIDQSLHRIELEVAKISTGASSTQKRLDVLEAHLKAHVESDGHDTALAKIQALENQMGILLRSRE